MVKIKTLLRILITLTRRTSLYFWDHILIVFYSIYNLITTRKIYDDEIIFVTAAEKNYFKQLEAFIQSFYKFSNNRLVIYDIGLDDQQVVKINKKYNKLEVRKFEFSKHPKFVSEYFENKLGSYAWKPILINDLLIETKSKVVWIDAGSIVYKKLTKLKIALSAMGMVTPKSSNTITEWTHKKTFEFIPLDKKYLKSSNFASGLIGFDYWDEKSLTVSVEWKYFSSIKECIRPSGSNRTNHRQDQALLTLLLYKHIFKFKIVKIFYIRSNFICGILFHNKKILEY